MSSDNTVDEANNSSNIKDKNKSKTCKDCQASFPTRSKLKYHRMKQHGSWKDKTWDCNHDECRQKFSTSSNLKRHVNKCHNISDANKDQEENKTCQECGYVSGDLYHLEIHKRKHNKERPFVCHQCQAGFSKKSDLKRHLTSCKGPKNVCQRCGEAFRYRKLLDQHSLWSTSCGVVAEALPDLSEESKSTAMVRFQVSKGQSVVGVDCAQLADPRVFDRAAKRVKCGLCHACTREDDCGECAECKSGLDKKKCCRRRRCINLLVSYKLRKGMEASVAPELNDGAEDYCLEDVEEANSTWHCTSVENPQ